MPNANDLPSLERELAQLKGQLPAHSIPPALLERIDELEDEIAALVARERTAAEAASP